MTLDTTEIVVDGRRDLARFPLPPDDRKAHAELIEAQHREKGDDRDRERTELTGAEDAARTLPRSPAC